MDGCLHLYCTDCIIKYIEVKVIHDNMSEIKCPNGNCTVFLDALSCRSILPALVFEKWCRVLCESAVLTKSSKGGLAYGRSYCPFRECSELVLNECVTTIASSSTSTSSTSTITKSTCPNCKKIFCFHCMVPWKENHGCTRRGGLVSDVDRNDLLFLEAARQENWTRCPNCSRYVERKRGCNWMMCRCKATFCYRCGCRTCICKVETRCCNWWTVVLNILVCYAFLAFVFMVLYMVLLGIVSHKKS
ncbi:hypothetical protein MKW94_004483 [Papaver nudicaule]|uniref:RING-type domain-containing protein n=1 Tax=Papaver nudicaule TaxID=74823 RepID=A0AA42AQZ9_PAPNU|nr:hypothetical protein [Papaver nudicaule]